MSSELFKFRDVELQLSEINPENSENFRHLRDVTGSSIELCVKAALFGGINDARYYTVRDITGQYCTGGRQTLRVDFYADKEEAGR